MTRRVWRIATDAPSYEANDLTGEGARITGGRWNAAGTSALYCSESRALACLETIVHLTEGDLPLNRYLVAVDIPDEIWAEARVETAASLKVGWDATPPGRVSLSFGTDWLISRAAAILVVPSAIIPEERNVLVNPLHQDTQRMRATKVRKWTYDLRLL